MTNERQMTRRRLVGCHVSHCAQVSRERTGGQGRVSRKIQKRLCNLHLDLHIPVTLRRLRVPLISGLLTDTPFIMVLFIVYVPTVTSGVHSRLHLNQLTKITHRVVFAVLHVDR